MKLKILLILLYISEYTFGQVQNFNAIIGQKYTDSLGNIFSLLNENFMVSNLNGYGDTAKYWIENDTVFTRQTYGTTGTASGKEDITHYYKFKGIDSNKIVLTNYGYYDRNYHKENVEFVFTNNKLLETNINDFEYVILEKLGPFWGYSKLKIYNNGNIEFFYDTFSLLPFSNYNNIDTIKTKGLKKGKLNKSELNQFMTALKIANIKNSSKNRFNCGMDRHDFNFTLKINSKFYYSLGCEILNQQIQLVELHNKLIEKYIIHL